jgi:hypothetical protein
MGKTILIGIDIDGDGTFDEVSVKDFFDVEKGAKIRVNSLITSGINSGGSNLEGSFYGVYQEGVVLDSDFTVNENFKVKGGNIVLEGTGRISGIDTVQSNGDAASKLYVDTEISNSSSGGTVTSIATTNGITGGTITSTGTIQLDSTVLRTSGVQNNIAGEKTFVSKFSIEDKLFLETGEGNLLVGNNETGQSLTLSGNIGIGASVFRQATSALHNTSVGYQSMYDLTTGNYNVASGRQALYRINTGSGNIGIGENAGSEILSGNETGTSNSTAENSIFIGRDTKALADGESNQIVIGYDAVGKGTNTVKLGNSSITHTYLEGEVSADRYKVNTMGIAPPSSTSFGVTGTIIHTSNYIYVCVASDTWKRTAISTW